MKKLIITAFLLVLAAFFTTKPISSPFAAEEVPDYGSVVATKGGHAIDYNCHLIEGNKLECVFLTTKITRAPEDWKNYNEVCKDRKSTACKNYFKSHGSKCEIHRDLRWHKFQTQGHTSNWEEIQRTVLGKYTFAWLDAENQTSRSDLKWALRLTSGGLQGVGGEENIQYFKPLRSNQFSIAPDCQKIVFRAGNTANNLYKAIDKKIKTSGVAKIGPAKLKIAE